MRVSPGWIFLSLLAASSASSASSAVAAAPPPLTSSVFEFPGSVASPGSSASAGVALSDSWLGDEPFENPAMPPARAFSLTPLLYHVSRQDLRGLNRSYSEQAAFIDGAGMWLAFRAGSLSLFAYGHQPALRFEENAYLTGPASGSPAPVENSSSARELRGGAGISAGRGWLRVGLAAEWTHRQDSYTTVDKSGSPQSGTFDLNYSGSAIGGQAGARIEWGPAGTGHVTVGGGVRFVPELVVEGDRSAILVTGNTNGPVRATRGSGVECGASARWTATSQWRLVAGVGGRTTQDWQGFGLTRGGGVRWGAGLDFHDARDPWTLRFGLGGDNARGVREPRNGILGLGFGWKMETTTVDVALSRHSFSHLSGANSTDDRVVVSVVQPF